MVRRGGDGGPVRAVIDSREVREGDLFFGLEGEHDDGGRFAPDALRSDAWGSSSRPSSPDGRRTLTTGLGVDPLREEPLAALQALARHWRRMLECHVVGITGSTGKTSVKDVCRAILPAEVHASLENFNTEIGLPLAVLSAPEDTDVLVLEMGMRGPGQIAELCAIAAPTSPWSRTSARSTSSCSAPSRRSPPQSGDHRRAAAGWHGGRARRARPARAASGAGAEADPVRSRRRRGGDLGVGRGGGRDRRARPHPRGRARVCCRSSRRTTSTTPSRRSPPAWRSATRSMGWRSGRRG